MNKNLLGLRIKELRKRKGMSQEFLADESGLSLRTIQRIENGETNPTGESLKRLSNALNVNPDELIEKAKKYAKVIRFFEPIDLPTNLEHPFTFSADDYRKYFGDSVKIYSSIGEPNFHGATCVYGVYNCK